MPDETAQPTATKAPACPDCGGTGFKMVDAEDAKGRHIQRASTCDCRLRARGVRLLEQARIPRRYEHCDLLNFEHDGPHRGLAPAWIAANRFVQEYPIERNGLLFVGSIGAGKTHLAVGIIKELILSKGIPCLFFDYRELLKFIQNSYSSSVQTTELQILQPVFDAEVLVLDELGAVRTSEWVWDTVATILNTRYNDKRTTIITTNYQDLPPGASETEEMNRSDAARASERETLGDRIGERMRSRLHEMCRIVAVNGDDFRMKYKRADFS